MLGTQRPTPPTVNGILFIKIILAWLENKTFGPNISANHISSSNYTTSESYTTVL